LDAALARARALAAAPPKSVQLAKMLLRQPHREAVLRVIDTEVVHFTERLGSADAQAALSRFFAAK
jgi:enoyl-CoA hydratase/carnithine racemase